MTIQWVYIPVARAYGLLQKSALKISRGRLELQYFMDVLCFCRCSAGLSQVASGNSGWRSETVSQSVCGHGIVVVVSVWEIYSTSRRRFATFLWILKLSSSPSLVLMASMCLRASWAVLFLDSTLLKTYVSQYLWCNHDVIISCSALLFLVQYKLLVYVSQKQHITTAKIDVSFGYTVSLKCNNFKSTLILNGATKWQLHNF